MLEVFVLRFLTGFGVVLGYTAALCIIILTIVYWKSGKKEDRRG